MAYRSDDLDGEFAGEQVPSFKLDSDIGMDYIMNSRYSCESDVKQVSEVETSKKHVSVDAKTSDLACIFLQCLFFLSS